MYPIITSAAFISVILDALLDSRYSFISEYLSMSGQMGRTASRKGLSVRRAGKTSCLRMIFYK